MKTMKHRMIVMLMVAAFALPAMGQFRNNEVHAQFHSTSSLIASGSQYSSTPTLNADGIAQIPSEPVSASGPRRAKQDDDISIVTPGQGGSQAPVGDEIWVLLLLAAGYAVARRRVANKLSISCAK